MITPIRSAHTGDVQEASKAPAPKPAPHPQTRQTPKSGELSHDQVTLKSAGQADHEDRK